MFYIFCNSNFHNAVKFLGLSSAKKEYSVNNPAATVQDFEVWQMTPSDSQALLDAEWNEEWGWWRWAQGSFIEFGPSRVFVVNGNEIKLYYDEFAIKAYANNLLQDPEDENYWPIISYEDVPDSIKQDYFLYNGIFNDIFEYCETVWQMQSEKHRAEIITANAKLNNLTPPEFLKKVVG